MEAKEAPKAVAEVEPAEGKATTETKTVTVSSAENKESTDSTGRNLEGAADTAEKTQPVSAGTNHGGSSQQKTVKKGARGDRYLFTESPVEYYYYHQPVVKKVQPKQGLTTGGTPIEVSGAWFDQKLDYGVIPYCAIGDKIVRA